MKRSEYSLLISVLFDKKNDCLRDFSVSACAHNDTRQSLEEGRRVKRGEAFVGAQQA